MPTIENMWVGADNHLAHLPSQQELQDLQEIAVSPSLPGNLYEIHRLIDSQNRIFAKKILKPEAKKHYTSDFSLENIFELHQLEHSLFIKHLGEFILPTVFYNEEKNNQKQFCVVQPWVPFGVQFKEAVKNARAIPFKQLPTIFERIRFIKGLTELLKDENVYPKIADVDFFLCDGSGHSKIKMIDTNFLWYPKLTNDSRRICFNLCNFLFPDVVENKFVHEAILELNKAFHSDAID